MASLFPRQFFDAMRRRSRVELKVSGTAVRVALAAIEPHDAMRGRRSAPDAARLVVRRVLGMPVTPQPVAFTGRPHAAFAPSRSTPRASSLAAESPLVARCSRRSVIRRISGYIRTARSTYDDRVTGIPWIFCSRRTHASIVATSASEKRIWTARGFARLETFVMWWKMAQVPVLVNHRLTRVAKECIVRTPERTVTRQHNDDQETPHRARVREISRSHSRSVSSLRGARSPAAVTR